MGSSVATPIELEVNGIENMMYMSSRSANDGSMTLTVTASEVETAINDQNKEIIAGKISHSPVRKHQQLEYTLEANGLLASPEEFADIIIRKGRTASSCD